MQSLRTYFTVSITALSLAAAVLAAGCDSGGEEDDSIKSGTLTIRADQGIDFRTGAVLDPGNFANSDLLASNNGDHLKLTTGGDSPVDNRRVNWFLGDGGTFDTFGTLNDVPTTKPELDENQALVRAVAGRGFVLETRGDGWVRGIIDAADASSVTVTFVPLDE